MVMISEPILGCPCHYVEWYTLTYNSSFLLFILKKLIKLLSQSRGVVSFRIEKRFVNMFRPTLFMLVFIILKVVWREVKI